MSLEIPQTAQILRFEFLAVMILGAGSMEDSLRGHLDKIRSDASECLVLSGLATGGKREVFSTMAEHLNSLASDLERWIAKRPSDRVPNSNVEEVMREATLAPHPKQQSAIGRLLPWLLIAVLSTIIAALIWSNNWSEKYRLFVQAKHEPSPASDDNSNKALVALLISGEQADRKLLLEQVTALAGRLKNLEISVDDLRKARVEAADPSSTGSIGTEQKSSAVTSPAPGIEKPVTTAEDRTAVTEGLTLPKQGDTVGPRGCTQFHSFDPKTGTYVTLDGRRRPCR